MDVDPELTPEDREALERLRKFSEEQGKKKRQAPARPDRYNYLPGFDDQGRKYPVHHPERPHRERSGSEEVEALSREGQSALQREYRVFRTGRDVPEGASPARRRVRDADDMHQDEQPNTATSARQLRERATRRDDVAAPHQVVGCLLAGAVGDALGAPVEFVSIGQIRAQFGPDGVTDYEPAYGRRGRITDDTQMTLFTLEGIIRAHHRGRTRGIVGTVEVVHWAYLRWLHTQGGSFGRSDRKGWLITNADLFHTRAPGNTCLSALRATAEHGLGTIDHPLNDSKGCGAVMRAAPVALWPGSAAEVFRLSAQIGALTHGHPSGYLSAGVLAVIVQQLFRGGDLPEAVATARIELTNWRGHEEQLAALDAAVALAERGRPTPEAIERLGGGWVGEEALAIALCAALSARDLPDGLLLAVNHSGDSDSTGSICGNILGAHDGVAAIPQRWLDGLELREVIETLARDAVTEFTRTPGSDDWWARYPGD